MRPDSITLSQTLAFRYTVSVLLLFALVSGLSITLLIFIDYHQEKTQIKAWMQQLLAANENMARYAIYDLDSQTADFIIQGFAQYPEIKQAHLITHDGRKLAEYNNNSKYQLLKLFFFDDPIAENHPLTWSNGQNIGDLALSVDLNYALRTFQWHSLQLLLLFIGLNAVVAGLVFIHFQRRIILPLEQIRQTFIQQQTDLPEKKRLILPLLYPENEIQQWVGEYNQHLHHLEQLLLQLRCGQQQAQDKQQRLARILDQAEIGLFQFDHQGHLVWASERTAKILGFDSADVLIHYFRQHTANRLYVHPYEHKKLLQQVQQQKKMIYQNVQLRHQQGHSIWVSLSIWAIFHQYQQVEYYEGTLITINHYPQ